MCVEKSHLPNDVMSWVTSLAEGAEAVPIVCVGLHFKRLEPLERRVAPELVDG